METQSIFAITNDQGTASVIDNGDTVTWLGSDQASGGTGIAVDVTGLIFGSVSSNKGAFGSIQAAIDAATAGDTIHIAPGTYTESLSITKSVTLLGFGAGQTIIKPAFGNGVTISGTSASDQIVIDGVEIKDASSGAGLLVISGTNLLKLTITNSKFENNFTNGVAVFGAGVAETLITNTSFVANGGYTHGSQTSSGDGDIIFFDYTGKATLSDLSIAGYSTGTGTNPSNNEAENGIQFRSDVGALGVVSLTNIAISGFYEKIPLAFYNYDNVNNLTVVNVTISADSTRFQQAVNFDGVGGDINLATLGISVTSSDPVSLQGDVGSNVLTAGTGPQLIRGYAGNDTLTGGAGIDTALFSGTSRHILSPSRAAV